MIFNIFGGLVKSLGVYRHSPLLLAVFLIIQLICIIVSCIFDNMYFKSVISETSFTNKRYNRVKHFVYDTIVNLSNSMFVLMVDEKTNIVSPALYTKKSNKISMINRNAEYTVFEHIDFSESHCPNEYKFIRACKLRDKKTGEQVLFVAVPNRETDILAYSDSLHKADKTVTFGKFRIFCFVESENSIIRYAKASGSGNYQLLPGALSSRIKKKGHDLHCCKPCPLMFRDYAQGFSVG